MSRSLPRRRTSACGVFLRPSADARGRRAPIYLRRSALQFLAFLCAMPLSAQVIPDTLARPDTTREARDTVPAVIFPAMPISGDASAAEATWVWDRDALLRETPISLVDLLARIPGVTAFRAGMFAQPEAASGLGGTAGRIEIVLDGFTLDPLAGSTNDLARIPLGQLREVRVERKLGVLKIHLLSDQPTAAQPYTRVEAGIGQPPANMFRWVFLAPRVIAGPLSFAIERLDTDGFGRIEPASVFNGWAKWGWTTERRGVQLEMIRSTVRREPTVDWATDRVRQDLVVRARNTFAPGLVGELFGGRSAMTDKPWRTAADTGDFVTIERDAVQAGARLGYATAAGTLGGSFRVRDGKNLPRTEGRIDANLGFGPAAVSAEWTHFTWEGGALGSTFDVYGRVTAPFGGSAFVQWTDGWRGGPLYQPDAGSPWWTKRSGLRVGAALSLGVRATGSVALINLDQDRALPFGLPFDSMAGPSVVGEARGIEAFGRVVLLPRLFALESWITNWTESAGWTYLPVRSWRTALELHTVPLPSGNLEILGRIEGAHRSGMLAYNPEPPPDDPTGYEPVVALPGYTLFHAYLQIRVIDVRAFLRYEDLLGHHNEDLPGRIHRGPRLMYGVKWNLWN